MKTKFVTYCSLLILFSFATIFCFPGQGTPYESTESDLQVSTPEQQGLDKAKMVAISDQAGEIQDISSLLIVHDGYLILEKYFQGNDQSTLFNVKSVSKSFISALIGIAIRDGFISGPEQKIAEFFPEYSRLVNDPQKKEITIRHLLTMTAGFEWLENGPVVQDWTSTSDWINFTFDLPQVTCPGEAFNYSTAGTHLLSAVISRATKMNALEFANKRLFPLTGMRKVRWDKDPQGYCFGGAEMFMTARDMAKFGLLYLNRGLVDGQQVIPEDWVLASTRRQAEVGGDPDKDGYGYLWWIRQYYGNYVYYASGYGGQYIFCAPELNLVVVTTSSLANSVEQDRIFKHVIAILKLLDRQILPAIIF